MRMGIEAPLRRTARFDGCIARVYNHEVFLTRILPSRAVAAIIARSESSVCVY